MIKAMVIELAEGDDLYAHDFESVEEARAFISDCETKCILVLGEDLTSEDHT